MNWKDVLSKTAVETTRVPNFNVIFATLPSHFMTSWVQPVEKMPFPKYILLIEQDLFGGILEPIMTKVSRVIRVKCQNLFLYSEHCLGLIFIFSNNCQNKWLLYQYTEGPSFDDHGKFEIQYMSNKSGPKCNSLSLLTIRAFSIC